MSSRPPVNTHCISSRRFRSSLKLLIMYERDSCHSTAFRNTNPNGISYTKASTVVVGFPLRMKQACVHLQKFRCRNPQLCPWTPNPSGSPAKLRPSSEISPEKTASECGVRENPIHPLLLKVTRKVDRYCRFHVIRWPSTFRAPRQKSSPISF